MWLFRTMGGGSFREELGISRRMAGRRYMRGVIVDVTRKRVGCICGDWCGPGVSSEGVYEGSSCGCQEEGRREY